MNSMIAIVYRVKRNQIAATHFMRRQQMAEMCTVPWPHAVPVINNCVCDPMFWYNHLIAGACIDTAILLWLVTPESYDKKSPHNLNNHSDNTGLSMKGNPLLRWQVFMSAQVKVSC